MRILVAGNAGFIGFHLTGRLLNDGHEVVGVDNFASGSPSNVEQFRELEGFSFHEHDISTPLPDLGPVERIYNMACPASPADFGPHPLAILAVCSQGIWNLLDYARRCNARLLQASTSEVYGDPKEHPQRESYWGHVNPVGPRSCYDEGKRFGEALCLAHRKQHDTETRIARIFNTYGPNMRGDDGRMLPSFIIQALTNQPLTVHGDGSQTRSFCYVTDLVEGLIRLMESDETGPVNLGNPVEISIREAAEEVIRLTDSASELSFIERPENDPSVRKPDITRAETILGWKPTIDRADGFARTIEWFRQRQ